MSDFKAVLRSIGMSQTELARRVGKDPGHINRILSGKIHPKPPLRKAIVEAVGGAISEEELAGFPRPLSQAS